MTSLARQSLLRLKTTRLQGRSQHKHRAWLEQRLDSSKAVVAALAIALLTLSGCATNPVTGKKDFVMMSEEQELALGQKVAEQVRTRYKPYKDEELQTYLSELGTELAANSHRSNLIFRFTLVDDPLVNAFAVPGGYIYITRGIVAYMNSEAELAGVVGHEIGHVTARHGVRKQATAQAAGLVGIFAAIATGNRSVADVTNILGTAFVNGYGRAYELEADRLGSEYLAANQYDPDDMLKVVGILKSHEEVEKKRAEAENREPRAYHGVFATHPENDDRLKEVVESAKKLEGQGGTRGKDTEAFLRLLDGMVYGDSEESGIVRLNEFYHRDLDLYINFPEQWRIDNLPKAVVATSRDNETKVGLTGMTDQSRKETARDYAERKFKIKDGQWLNGENEGYMGIARVKAQNGSSDVRVAVVFHKDRVLEFQAVTKKGLASESELRRVAESARSIRDDEQQFAKARRLKIVRARAGDTFESLGKLTPLTNYAADELRLLNGMFPDGQPAEGQLIKTVE